MKRRELASPYSHEVDVASPRVMERLAEAGAVICLNKLPEIWHGRAGHDIDEWRVDPFFVTNGSNIYQNAFYATPHRQDASDFAFARARAKDAGTPNLVKIAPNRPNQYVVKSNAPAEIAQEMIVPLSNAVPASSTAEAIAVVNVTKNYRAWLAEGRGMFTEEDIQKFAQSTNPGNISRDEWQKAMDRYCRAYNSLTLIASGRLLGASGVMFGKSNWSHRTRKPDGSEETLHFPMSKEYIDEVFARAGIIGESANLLSGTLGRPIKDALMIWDPSGLQRKKQVHNRKIFETEALKPLTGKLLEFAKPQLEKNPYAELRTTVSDPYSSPPKIMAAAHKIPEVAALLNKPAGVWEGYTVGEHTEASLAIFERTFADDVPAEFIGLIKTALLVHDIGKGRAHEEGQRSIQEDYNRKHAAEILQKMGYDSQVAEIVLRIIGPGMRHYSDFYRYGEHEAEFEEHNKTLSRLMRDDGRSASHLLFANLQRVMYVCDAGAYTEMGRYTRFVKEAGARVVVKSLRSLDYLFTQSNGGRRVKQNPISPLKRT